ncbi:MAG: tRNA epoxyqueuosine(34) reductase QueG [Bacteroidales bacterium]|nr:tRNA epoxyqueuosine(34) reductase QueG [Bacteroidales bacterium]HOY38197.1 tRNA epoxyqueuosine(34) reductase QueG [Bacteroidales bacterium]HQP03000.1 tRNA epoxyqueuosine(34) reductase QueG [Bacteroidales bacterium]
MAADHLTNDTIKKAAHMLGFDGCGISSAFVPDSIKVKYEKAISLPGYQALEYIRKNLRLRFAPDLLVENALSVISLFAYYSFIPDSKKNVHIARYAHSSDYHLVLKNQAYKLLKKLQEYDNSVEGRVFVDSGPVMEKHFAVLSGIGFQGKNTCIIHPRLGSFGFLCEILINKKVEYDTPVPYSCGDCSLCVDACPTSALRDYQLNPEKCISFHTIENKQSVPEEIRARAPQLWFGCDICQEVCPYNKIQMDSRFFIPENAVQDLSYDELVNMNEENFKECFSKTPLGRAGLKKLRNSAGIKDKDI